MALPGVASLKADIEALAPSDDKAAAMDALAAVVGAYMNQVQAGPLGAPGILTFDEATFSSQLQALAPVGDDSWIAGFAAAWEAAVLASTIAISTVTDSTSWPVSITDTLTVTDPSTTITTIATAKSTLESGLAASTADNNPPEPMAQAIHDATLAFSFNTIGLGGTPISPVPVPVPRDAL